MNILSIFRYNKPQYKIILTYIIAFVKGFWSILFILENNEGTAQMRDPPFMSDAIARTVLILIVLIVLILVVLILIVLILVVLVLVLVILAVAIVVLIFVIHFAILLAIRME
jgi:hypothetical protein